MNKKGVIFTIDVIMAITIVFLIITAARMQMAGVDAGYLHRRYAQELADDTVGVMDAQGVLATLDNEAIESNISRLLPASYEMWAEIESYGLNLSISETLEVGEVPPEGANVVSGRRIFISGEEDIERYNVINYKIWLR